MLKRPKISWILVNFIFWRISAAVVLTCSDRASKCLSTLGTESCMGRHGMHWLHVAAWDAWDSMGSTGQHRASTRAA